MNDLLSESLSGIIPHLQYLLLATVILAGFIWLFSALTPYREFALIRQNNSAAAISLGGSIIGFGIPLAKAVAQSIHIVDMLIWSLVALIAQLLVYISIRFIFRSLEDNIQNNQSASALFLAIISITIGLLNAAAMTV